MNVASPTSPTAAPTTPESHASAATPALPSKAYRRYALIVLLAAYTLNFLDRQILAILAEPIKQDLGFQDWQLGLLTGLAFALFYTILGIPIASLSERGNRPMIIGSAIAVWSGFTALCGMAQSYWQLVLARVGVGVGEAGCTPPAISLITDYTPPQERASALSIYLLGAPLGALIGIAAGGLIADTYGWRMAFLIAGAPGVVLSLVVLTTLSEPRKRLTAEMRARAASVPAPNFKKTVAMLRKSRTYVLICSAISLQAFISYGTTAFIASFFFRNHAGELDAMAAQYGLQSAGFLGLALGLVMGASSAVGTVVGGYVADHFGRKDIRAYVILPTVGVVVAAPFTLAAYSVSSMTLALCLLAIPTLFNALWFAPSFAAIQGLVPANSRATATAIMMFFTNLIGLGIGPLGVGILSDLIAGSFGPAAGVRYALITVSLAGIPTIWMFWDARKTIAAETIS